MLYQQESSDYYLNDGTRVDFDIMRDDVFDRLIKAMNMITEMTLMAMIIQSQIIMLKLM